MEANLSSNHPAILLGGWVCCWPRLLCTGRPLFVSAHLQVAVPDVLAYCGQRQCEITMHWLLFVAKQDEPQVE
jgi:hypothetical protein